MVLPTSQTTKHSYCVFLLLGLLVNKYTHAYNCCYLCFPLLLLSSLHCSSITDQNDKKRWLRSLTAILKAHDAQPSNEFDQVYIVHFYLRSSKNGKCYSPSRTCSPTIFELMIANIFSFFLTHPCSFVKP